MSSIMSVARDLDRVIKKYRKEEFHYPSFDWLLENTGNEGNVLNQAIDHLGKHDQELQDFYKLGLEPKPSIDVIGKPFFPIEKISNKVDKLSNNASYYWKRITNINFTSIYIFIAFIAGVIASIIRVNISSIFFQSMFDTFWAFMFALAWVLFAIISFEAIFFFQEKKHWAFFWISIFLCFIVTGFSMISTTKALYDVMITKEVKSSVQTVVNNNNAELKKIYEDQLEQDKKDRLDTIKERNHIQNLLEKEEDPKSYNFRDLSIRLSVRKKEITDIENNSKAIKQKLEQLITDNKETLTDNSNNDTSKLTFVQAVSSLWNWNPSIINLILTIFPAVFLDFMPPFCFAVVLFLGRKEKVEKKDKKKNNFVE